MFENVRTHFDVPEDARMMVAMILIEVRLVTSALVPLPPEAVSQVADVAPAIGPTVSAIAGEPVSNSKPLGALRIRMPEPISPGFDSSIDGCIAKFVQAGELPDNAVSADTRVNWTPTPADNREARATRALMVAHTSMTIATEDKMTATTAFLLNIMLHFIQK